MATYEDDMDFYDEEEPEISQNLALLQSILQQNQDQNALQKTTKQWRNINNNKFMRYKRKTTNRCTNAGIANTRSS